MDVEVSLEAWKPGATSAAISFKLIPLPDSGDYRVTTFLTRSFVEQGLPRTILL